MDDRIFVGWGEGNYAYATSLSPTFQQDLTELIRQYGEPDTVEFRRKNERITSEY